MLIHDGVCDAILAIFVTALVTEAADVALALHGVSQSEPDVPIAAVFMTSEGPPAELSGDAVTVPGYGFPEEAARAVALASSYGRWRSRPERGVSAPKGIRVDEAAAIISRQLARGLGWLPPRAVSELLDCHGLPLVQPMAAPGVELIVGVANDPSFGPVVACGSRGTVAELIKDVSVRITPLSDDDAHEMLRELRTFPMLDGYQGAPRCDLGAIEDVLLRVSALVEAHPEIAELDLNPLVARADGATILDARIRVEEAPAPPPISSLDA
jgi:acyl-CoA synthetase (NDP forming)